jgi:hypothetical protein
MVSRNQIGTDLWRLYLIFALHLPAVGMHIDDESDTDDSDQEDPMVHAGSPAMFPHIGSPYGQPLSAVGSPEDVKPNIGYPGPTSPPARGSGGHLPWMTDNHGQTASAAVSAAPSPGTPFDVKSEVDDGMDVDVNLNSEASVSGSEDEGEATQEQPELTLEQKMQQRFPTFEKHRPLKFTDLQAIDLRDPKKRRLEDHVGELAGGRRSSMTLYSHLLGLQSPRSNRNILCIPKRRAFYGLCQQLRAYIKVGYNHGQLRCREELDNARIHWVLRTGCIA